MHKIKKIGITGGIGSGKSYICKIFESLGYKIYYADLRAKVLMEHDEKVRQGLIDIFGEEVYLPNKQLNRPHLAGIIFTDKNKLKEINALVHPAVGRDFKEWYEKILQSEYDKSFILKEAAILFESGSYRESDGVISVYAPRFLRIERVKGRDQTSEASIIDRMDKQWSDLNKVRLADCIIFNDGDKMLLPQIAAAIRLFKEKPLQENQLHQSEESQP